MKLFVVLAALAAVAVAAPWRSIRRSEGEKELRELLAGLHKREDAKPSKEEVFAKMLEGFGPVYLAMCDAGTMVESFERLITAMEDCPDIPQKVKDGMPSAKDMIAHIKEVEGLTDKDMEDQKESMCEDEVHGPARMLGALLKAKYTPDMDTKKKIVGFGKMLCGKFEASGNEDLDGAFAMISEALKHPSSELPESWKEDIPDGPGMKAHFEEVFEDTNDEEMKKHMTMMCKKGAKGDWEDLAGGLVIAAHAGLDEKEAEKRGKVAKTDKSGKSGKTAVAKPDGDKPSKSSGAKDSDEAVDSALDDVLLIETRGKAGKGKGGKKGSKGGKPGKSGKSSASGSAEEGPVVEAAKALIFAVCTDGENALSGDEFEAFETAVTDDISAETQVEIDEAGGLLAVMALDEDDKVEIGELCALEKYKEVGDVLFANLKEERGEKPEGKPEKPSKDGPLFEAGKAVITAICTPLDTEAEHKSAVEATLVAFDQTLVDTYPDKFSVGDYYVNGDMESMTDEEKEDFEQMCSDGDYKGIASLLFDELKPEKEEKPAAKRSFNLW